MRHSGPMRFGKSLTDCFDAFFGSRSAIGSGILARSFDVPGGVRGCGPAADPAAVPAVPAIRRSRESGGTGRRAGFRFRWGNP